MTQLNGEVDLKVADNGCLQLLSNLAVMSGLGIITLGATWQFYCCWHWDTPSSTHQELTDMSFFFSVIKYLKFLLIKNPRWAFDSFALKPICICPDIDSFLSTGSKLLNRSLTCSGVAAVPRHRHTN